jgi:hypothetical protein
MRSVCRRARYGSQKPDGIRVATGDYTTLFSQRTSIYLHQLYGIRAARKNNKGRQSRELILNSLACLSWKQQYRILL